MNTPAHRLLANLAAKAPTRTELVPWTDRKNRLHPLRATVFGLLLLPALWLLLRAALHGLGPEPINAAIHSTGYWTIWLLIACLAVTPLKALSSAPSVAVVRRMIGNAALVYAVIHLALYATDQHWRLFTVAAEIVKRFYLSIGAVAGLGLVILGATSTDAWARAMGAGWKRLHRLTYLACALGLVHYLLQSKLDVSQALLAGGVFTWLMLWRALPTGHDRQWPVLAATAAAAAATTLLYEYVWYRFGTRVDPMKVLRAEFDLSYGLHPAGQVLLLGLLATAGAALRQLALRFAEAPWFTMAVYGLAAFAFDAANLFGSRDVDDIFPDGPDPRWLDGAWLVMLAVVGALRWRMRGRIEATLLDALTIATILAQVVAPGPATRGLEAALACAAAALLIRGARRLRTMFRAPAPTAPAANAGWREQLKRNPGV